MSRSSKYIQKEEKFSLLLLLLYLRIKVLLLCFSRPMEQQRDSLLLFHSLSLNRPNESVVFVCLNNFGVALFTQV